MDHGINVDPLNPHGRPDASLLIRLGFDAVRLVLRPDVRSYIDICRALDLDALGVIARESGDPAQYAGWGCTWLQVGNEPDSTGPSSWSMRPEDYLGLWRRCRTLFPDVPLIVGGLASGNPYRGEQYWDVEGAAAIAVHPYAKQTPAAAALLHQYADLSGMPIWVTEWWRPAAEVVEFAAMLETYTERAWWFSWHDFEGWAGGLVSLDGGLRPEFHALMEVLRMPTLTERVELLERQQSMLVEAVAKMLEGNWTETMPHAAALLKAINPGWEGQPVPFPKGR